MVEWMMDGWMGVCCNTLAAMDIGIKRNFSLCTVIRCFSLSMIHNAPPQALKS